MKINIFPIVSSLHEQDRINEETKKLLDELFLLSNHEFEIVTIDKLYDADLSLILIQSGGSEQLLIENYVHFKAPFYLLTYGTNNSLAASLEILSFLKDNNLDGEVLHGSSKYINDRINTLLESKDDNNYQYRYGVIGKPSDWLIASKINYKTCQKLHKIKLIDIEVNELTELFNNQICPKIDTVMEFDKEELNKAYKLNSCINMLKNKYQLDGLTIRCFDLLDSIKTTACLSLSLLNNNNIVSTCEGDIPSMISMHVLKLVTNQVGFQANPSKINIEDKTMVLAHCTLPLNMCSNFEFKTHYESNSGVAIKGELKKQEITIFKLSRDLKNYFVTTGTIIDNLNETNLCRTQIRIKVDDNIEYFLTRPYGNHHIIVYGNHKEKIINYMKNIK